MNSYLAAVISIVVALLPFFTPGISIFSSKRQSHLLAWGARLILVSLITWVITTYIVTVLNLPIIAALVIIAAITVVYAVAQQQEIFSLTHGWYILAIALPLLICFALWSVPLLKTQDGLPTGDAQKAIIWAQEIIKTKELPDYQSSLTRLNRDPVDFYTPGLHTTIAAIMAISPLPLHTVSFFAIFSALAVALVGAAISKDLFDTRERLFPATLVALLILTNIRFLRYLRQPGYHLQNSIGELLLFGLLMIGLSLIHRWRTKEVILGCLTIIALLLTHQFSSFIAAFILLPVAGMFLVSRRHIFINQLRQRPLLLAITLIAIITMVGGGMSVDLQEKIPHIFTTQPHLTDELPLVSEYPPLLGPLFLTLSIGGFVLLILHTKKYHPHYREAIAFMASIVMLGLLTQGPRLFIDVPPIRALFYAVVPLGICAGYFIAKTIEALNPRERISSLVVTVCLLVSIAGAGITNIHTAIATISHTVRSDSSLTPAIQYITEQLEKGKPGAVIVDDYDRRSSSWFMLGSHPVFSRVASEGSRQMNEALQSPLRQKLYFNQLDFEKIYSLGNWPGILPLLEKHDIHYVTGTAGISTSAFMHNPLFSPFALGDDITVFERNSTESPTTSQLASQLTKGLTGNTTDIVPWLLKSATIANDIGDADDALPHMAISLVSTRLSNPQFDGEQTYRVIHAPQFVLRINMQDYVRALWDKDKNNKPDIASELFLSFVYAPASISVSAGGEPVQLTSSHSSIIRFEAKDVTVAPDGSIHIVVNNPTEQPVALDLVAFGPARVP